jgi:hypothetical protein
MNELYWQAVCRETPHFLNTLSPSSSGTLPTVSWLPWALCTAAPARVTAAAPICRNSSQNLSLQAPPWSSSATGRRRLAAISSTATRNGPRCKAAYRPGGSRSGSRGGSSGTSYCGRRDRHLPCRARALVEPSGRTTTRGSPPSPGSSRCSPPAADGGGSGAEEAARPRTLF